MTCSLFNWLLKQLSIGAAGKIILPGDTYLVSYPKSGSTWLRYLLSYLCDNATHLAGMERVVPDIYRHRNPGLLFTRYPRILKSHERRTSAYRKVLYLARDPRSVFVSVYWHHRQSGTLSDDQTFDCYLPKFLSTSTTMKHFRWGAWNTHVASWLAAPPSRFLLIRYEDLLCDTVGELAKIMEFTGIKTPEGKVQEAIASGQLTRLRQQEEEENWTPNRFPVQRDVSFFRTGKSDEWKEVLTMRQIRGIEASFGAEMKRLGYERYNHAQ